MFDCFKKPFCNGIIPTISFATHTLYKRAFLEPLGKSSASILDASIRMDHQTPRRISVASGAFERLKDQSMIQRLRKRPADDLTRKQINEDRQIHPPLLQSDIGNIADPHAIGRIDLEAAPESIRRHRKSMLRLSGHPKTAAHNRAQPHRLHPFSDSILADFPVFRPKRPRNFGATRSTAANLVESFNRPIQSLGFLLASTRTAFLPGVKPTTRHLQHPAHLSNTPQRAVLENKAIAIHYRPSEKMASAFFKISRSRCNRSFSRCKWRTCSSFADKWPLPGKASAPSLRSCRFYREIIPWLRPKRRSISVACAPSSAAKWMASSLNSRSYFTAMDTPP